jgi:hypothetical protein
VTEYIIQTVTNNEWEFAGDAYDFNRITKLFLFSYLNYTPEATTLSATVEKYYAEDEWHHFSGCNHAPDDVKTHDDSAYFTKHAIVGGGAWEVMDGGRIKKVRNQLALCLYGWEDDNVFYLKQHPIGQCPHYLYHKDVVRDVIIKCTSTVYVRVRAEDENERLEEAIQTGMERCLHEERIDDEVRDVFEYEFDGDIEDIAVRIHNQQYTPVRRMP